jgi:hypothetical protein
VVQHLIGMDQSVRIVNLINNFVLFFLIRYVFIDALGWQPCSITVPCDTSRGLTCSNTSNTCQCDQYSYWDNVTTFWCQSQVILINMISVFY